MYISCLVYTVTHNIVLITMQPYIVSGAIMIYCEQSIPTAISAGSILPTRIESMVLLHCLVLQIPDHHLVVMERALKDSLIFPM